MKNHKVVFEIEVNADTPLEAAKEVQSWLDDGDTKWQFYVQAEDSDKVFSIDLSEDDSCAVLELQTKYQPMIK
jgi:hypothetical protein